MNVNTQTNPVLNHDEIARLACQIWQKEGAQMGRDQEYWLQAEWQLRAISQSGNCQKNNNGVKRSLELTLAEQPASQPAESPVSRRKRVPVKFVSR